MCLPYLRRLSSNPFERNHGTHHSEEPSGFNVKEPKVSIGTSSSSTFISVGASLVADVGPLAFLVCCSFNTAIVSSSAAIRDLSRSISSWSSFVSLSMNLHRRLVRSGTYQGDQSVQYDLPSAFPGLEFTLWAYTLTPTADTSATWSGEGSKAGMDIKIGLTLFYCTAR